MYLCTYTGVLYALLLVHQQFLLMQQPVLSIVAQWGIAGADSSQVG